MSKFIIGRTYNKHGVADYYGGTDTPGTPFFVGKKAAMQYTNQNEAFGMTIRLKRLLPTIMGGAPATYSVIELEA
jgi:hypothetical protein